MMVGDIDIPRYSKTKKPIMVGRYISIGLCSVMRLQKTEDVLKRHYWFLWISFAHHLLSSDITKYRFVDITL